MIFKELAVKNYGNIKSAKIDLDYTGLTFIFGRNKDGGPNATNGAGKSQLWSAIPEIAYGSPPTGKDGHKHKSAKIRLKFQSNSTEIAFVKDFNAKGGKKFTVLKNGEDVNTRTLDYAEKKLQQYIGKTEEDFYTQVYVDSLKIHPLIIGSAAQRQDFFVRRFNLENVDNVRKLLLKELAEVQKNVATYREVQSMFEESKARLTTTSEEREQIDRDIRRVTKERDSLLDKASKLQDLRDLIAFGENNKALIDRFSKVSTVESFEEDRVKFKSLRKRLKQDIETAQEWKVYLKALRKHLDALDTVQPKLKKLGVADESTEDIKEKASKYADLNAELKQKKAALRELENDIQEVPSAKTPKYEDSDQIRRKIDKLREELEHTLEFKDGKCPTCGSKVKGRDAKEIRDELSTWEARDRVLKDYLKADEIASQNKAVMTRIDTLTVEVQKLEAKVSKYKAYHEALSLLDDMPDKPEKPDGEEQDVSVLDEKLEKVTKKLAVLDSAEDIIPLLRRYQKLTDEQRERAKSADKVGQKLTDLNTQLTSLEVKRNQQAEVVKQLEQLRSRGKVLKRSVDDEVILKTLVNAYSTKGLKKFMIQRYASLLETQVNKFARFTFSEDFTFEFKYDKRLEVLVHRRYGKKTKTTDVKRLSGAEKRMFTLLLVIATYTLTPQKQRSNVLILDEMEANMGPEAIQNFLKALPVLNKIVPHIVVITPKPELHVDGARSFTAVKKNGVTTLVEGRV